MEEKLKYCPHCLGNDIKSKRFKLEPGDPRIKLIGSDQGGSIYYTIYKGFVTYYTYEDNSICPTCGEKMIEMNLTEKDWNTLNNISLEQDFIFAMDKLKQDNIVEFTMKMSQFKETINQQSVIQNQIKNSSQSPTPKCPTCGSTNIKKISATKRWIGAGLFGLASSDFGKTMQCDECGYKW